mgnify:CR=1 FL=1
MRNFTHFPFGPILLVACVPYTQYYGVYAISEAHRAALIIAITLFGVMGIFCKFLNSWSTIGTVGVIISVYAMKLYDGPIYPAIIIAAFLLFSLLDRKISFGKTILLANILGPVFAVLSLYPIMTDVYAPRHVLKTTSAPIETTEIAQTPSIVHIVLDGYGSSDVLSDVYRHDNKDFISALENRDFQVLPRVTSPFNQTLFVMSSIMSGGYISIPENTDNVRSYRYDLGHTAVNGTVHNLLRTAGYNFAYTKSGYAYLDFEKAELITPSEFGVTGLEAELLRFKPELAAKVHNQILRSALSSKNFENLQPPFFYYQHLLAPHPPFTLTKNGLPRPSKSIHLSDGSHFVRGSEERRASYINGYQEKINFVEKALLEQLKAVPSDLPIIIIIHGDHGPGANFDQESTTNSCIPERMTTFFAIYSNVPEIREAFSKHNNSDFNLVNIYRVIVSAISNQKLDPLPSKAKFLRWSTPSDAVTISKDMLSNECK